MRDSIVGISNLLARYRHFGRDARKSTESRALIQSIYEMGWVLISVGSVACIAISQLMYGRSTFCERVRTVPSLRDSVSFSHPTQDSAPLRHGLTALPPFRGSIFAGSTPPTKIKPSSPVDPESRALTKSFQGRALTKPRTTYAMGSDLREQCGVYTPVPVGTFGSDEGVCSAMEARYETSFHKLVGCTK